MLWLTVDVVAKRYGVLPSQLLNQGDNFDLLCAEFAIAYEGWAMKNKDANLNNTHGLSQEDMLASIERVRGLKIE